MVEVARRLATLETISEGQLPQRPSVRTFRYPGDSEAFGVMFYNDDTQCATDTGQIAPQGKIGLQFTDVTDTVGEKDLEPIAGNDQETANGVGLLHRQKQLVQGAMTGGDVAGLPLKGDKTLWRFFQRVQISCTQDARSDVWQSLHQPAKVPQGLNTGYLDQLDTIASSAFLSALGVDGEGPGTMRPVCQGDCLLYLIPGMLKYQ